jgi:hypothetical protein
MASPIAIPAFGRRPWPLIAALLLFLAFTGLHQIWFHPKAVRFAKVRKQSSDMGMVLGEGALPPMVSPRVLELLTDNSLQAGVAEQQGNSGALTAAMLEDLTKLAARRGIAVLATEQGSVTQLESSVLVRAHLHLRCRNVEFVQFLDDLARSGTLYAVDRFALVDAGNGRQDLDLWASQTILKQSAARP